MHCSHFSTNPSRPRKGRSPFRIAHMNSPNRQIGTSGCARGISILLCKIGKLSLFFKRGNILFAQIPTIRSALYVMVNLCLRSRAYYCCLRVLFFKYKHAFLPRYIFFGHYRIPVRNISVRFHIFLRIKCNCNMVSANLFN